MNFIINPFLDVVIICYFYMGLALPTLGNYVFCIAKIKAFRMLLKLG